MPRCAILYLTHYISDQLIARVRSIVDDCAGLAFEPWILYDATRAPCEQIAGLQIHEFELSSVMRLGTPMIVPGKRAPAIVPGNTDYPLIHFYFAHPYYAYYWVIEHDVRFTGSWRFFFSSCDLSRADLLTTSLESFANRPMWCWWNSLRHGPERVDKKLMVRGFLPVYRVSQSACRTLAQEYRKGWRGHFEVRLPTILSLNDHKLEDIGGDGAFVGEGNRNRFYIGEDANDQRQATFRWRPVMQKPGDLPNKLWHPVKDDITLKSV